jgi:Dicarboxylate carrier protein MatC N-terminus
VRSPAVLSLLALLVALGLSMSSRINVGWIALAFAWLIGVYQAGMRPDAVTAGFPVSLFLPDRPLSRHQHLTIAVVAAWILGVAVVRSVW